MNTIENHAECLQELLSVDRNDWDSYHEDFVRILHEFGYEKYMTADELGWHNNKIEDGEYEESISDYICFNNP